MLYKLDPLHFDRKVLSDCLESDNGYDPDVITLTQEHIQSILSQMVARLL